MFSPGHTPNCSPGWGVRRVLVQDVHRRWVATELDWKFGLAGRRESG